MGPRVVIANVAVLAIYALGRGSFVLNSPAYMASNGMPTALRAAGLMAPIVTVVSAVVFAIAASARLRATLALFGVLWFAILVSSGTRVAVLMALAWGLVLGWVLRRRPIVGVTVAIALLAVALYAFQVTLTARSGSPGGLANLPALTGDTSPDLPVAVRGLLTSFFAFVPIVGLSVIHAPEPSVILALANPLPVAALPLDASSFERLWPLEWVPMAFLGAVLGSFGVLGSVLFYGTASFCVGISLRGWGAGQLQTWLAAVSVSLYGLLVLFSIQYSTRVNVRILGLLIIVMLLSLFLSARRSSPPPTEPVVPGRLSPSRHVAGDRAGSGGSGRLSAAATQAPAPAAGRG